MGEVLDRGKCNAAQGAQDGHVLLGQGGLLADAIQQVGDAGLAQMVDFEQTLPGHHVPKIGIKVPLNQAVSSVDPQAEQDQICDGLKRHDGIVESFKSIKYNHMNNLAQVY